ncbi:ABC transporter ATP-binding protein [Fulvivirga sp. RKSG066]|uniref:ABC transporter ATP-binding protein n=1 Tax=Fulvivirga aurantia TaxID=2529383 RepID=UPI0012BBBB35|nr:ABC transporter ATP-binding protein [Fulvivirga aurantia]MTI20174.1 ABC transporter ATP-binding protein [Fulvivirga aurantia]
MDTVLSIKNLTKHYGRVKALNNLSLDVARGNVFGILGPNGSGKTTTLGILLDVINKTSGEFAWFGQPPSKEVRKRIGAILETPIFYPYLSATKNLQIVAKIKGASVENIDPVLKRVELYERRHDKFRTYSLGMKQRLSIASALLCDPEVMILDEPTNGLDPQGIAEIRELIKEIAKDGKTIILASHLLDEVQKVCSHFCVLKKGNLIYTGSVEDVSKGAVTVEVSAEDDDLSEILEAYEGSTKVEKDGVHHLVSLKEGKTATELNAYLFSKGITVSHLNTQRKSLEKQFLELLAESDNA